MSSAIVFLILFNNSLFQISENSVWIFEFL